MEMRPSRKQNKRTTNKIKKLVCKNRHNNWHTILGNILNEIQTLKLEVMRSAKGTNKVYRALKQQERHMHKLAAKVEIKEKRNKKYKRTKTNKRLGRKEKSTYVQVEKTMKLGKGKNLKKYMENFRRKEKGKEKELKDNIKECRDVQINITKRTEQSKTDVPRRKVKCWNCGNSHKMQVPTDTKERKNLQTSHIQEP